MPSSFIRWPLCEPPFTSSGQQLREMEPVALLSCATPSPLLVFLFIPSAPAYTKLSQASLLSEGGRGIINSDPPSGNLFAAFYAGHCFYGHQTAIELMRCATIDTRYQKASRVASEAIYSNLISFFFSSQPTKTVASFRSIARVTISTRQHKSLDNQYRFTADR